MRAVLDLNCVVYRLFFLRDVGLTNMKFSHTGYLGFEENRKDQPTFKERMGENILHEEPFSWAVVFIVHVPEWAACWS